jgi:hypothetical protein
MFHRSSTAAVALACALMITAAGAQAFDETKYPNLKGQWERFIVPGLPGQPSFDQTKPWGFGQEAPKGADRCQLECRLWEGQDGVIGRQLVDS